MTAMSLHHHKSPPARTVPPRAVVELFLSGDLDMQDAAELERFLTGALERGCDIVIDLAEVRLIDCVCLDVLVRAARAAHALDSAINLVAPSKLVSLTLRCTETDTLFSISGDRAGLRR